MSKRNQTFSPITLNQRPFSVNNSSQNNNQVFQPLEPNSFKISKKRDFFQNTNIQNRTFYNLRKSSDTHKLEFYALGKVSPNKTKYSNLEWNKGIKSTSNDIMQRNALSIHTRKFDGMNIHKNLSNLSEQNISQNNYLDPVKIYKTCEKYNLPKYATNVATYKLMKEKYYAKDMHSQIAQGRPLSRKEFIKQKANLIKNNKLNLTHKSLRTNVIDKKEEKKGINKSCSVSTGLEYKDPNDYSKQLLKNNYLYFDKNNTQIIRHKKWKFKGKW
jgi:hypothetical protein